MKQYTYPQINLLKQYPTNNSDSKVDNKQTIVNLLKNYKIGIESITETIGSTITLFEIVPAMNVKISRVKNLEDDIKLRLKAKGIRIYPTENGTIGIEVPNKDPQIVSMHECISDKRFSESNFDLPIAIGKTITNETFVFDLAKMPHLLVAGATGQGKSVGLNAIITSLLYKKSPDELKFVFVDPKMVELNVYSKIEKHYLAKLPNTDKPIITDVNKAQDTLESLTKEMDNRYELLMNEGVRNIKDYNKKIVEKNLQNEFLPYIVVVIDEYGDLIMTAGKNIELPITRIAQKARAVGIHLVISTQRPTTNIITGTIKANFPARIAFRVASNIDSRTILDEGGANQLIGRGDMLFSTNGETTRVQCAFVDTPEIDLIVDHISNQEFDSKELALPCEQKSTIQAEILDFLIKEAERSRMIQKIVYGNKGN